MTLVALTHGPLHPAGARVVHAVLERVRGRLPGVTVRPAYVGRGRPLLAEALVAEPAPAVVVPLLLSPRGPPDVPGPLDLPAGPHVVADRLGPDRLLAEVVHDRLREVGVRRGQPVVLVAAGSSDASVTGDTTRAAALLAEIWGGPVGAAHLTGSGPRMSEVAADLLARGMAPPAVAPYLLAPGHHYHKALDDARSLRLGTVAAPLGNHPLVAEAVARRYRAAVARRFALSLR
jgi:sirohydrochlorin ferrochelatase